MPGKAILKWFRIPSIPLVTTCLSLSRRTCSFKRNLFGTTVDPVASMAGMMLRISSSSLLGKKIKKSGVGTAFLFNS